MKKYNLPVAYDNEEGAVERLPIFLVLLGAEIRNYENELYEDFEATGQSTLIILFFFVTEKMCINNIFSMREAVFASKN